MVDGLGRPLDAGGVIAPVDCYEPLRELAEEFDLMLVLVDFSVE